MPNWCSNTLIIKGKTKDISKLIKQVEITESEGTELHAKNFFSFHKIIPRPVSEDSNWYNWNCDNWGTKWDSCETSVSLDWEDSGEIIYCFETAWNGVPDVIHELAKQHKKLSMNYVFYEGGMGFYGEQSYEKGKLVHTESGDLSEASCSWKEANLGDHHFCIECGSEIGCDGENTQPLCDYCLDEEEALDENLWKEETNEGETDKQIEVA